MKKVCFKDIGLVPYSKAWEYQEKLFSKIVDNKKKSHKNMAKSISINHLIFCEHPHVLTLGKSGNISNLTTSMQKLNTQNVEFVKSNRGGDITYHGPGQIVSYPIFDLDQFFTDIHLYMRSLEEVVIRTIREYGLKGERLNNATGVWLDVAKNPRKICALGVRSSRWVTMHGFALNVNTDLSYYKLIIPCGISKKDVTSLESELNKKIDLEEVKTKIKYHFANVFNFKYIKS